MKRVFIFLLFILTLPTLARAQYVSVLYVFEDEHKNQVSSSDIHDSGFKFKFPIHSRELFGQGKRIAEFLNTQFYPGSYQYLIVAYISEYKQRSGGLYIYQIPPDNKQYKQIMSRTYTFITPLDVRFSNPYITKVGTWNVTKGGATKYKVHDQSPRDGRTLDDYISYMIQLSASDLINLIYKQEYDVVTTNHGVMSSERHGNGFLLNGVEQK